MRGKQFYRGKPLIGTDMRRLDDEFLDAVLFGKRTKRLVNILRPAMQDVGLALFDAVIGIAGLAGEFLRLFTPAEVERPAVAEEYTVDALTFHLSRGMGGVAGRKSRQSKDRSASAAFLPESREAAAENLRIAIEMAGKHEIPPLEAASLALSGLAPSRNLSAATGGAGVARSSACAWSCGAAPDKNVVSSLKAVSKSGLLAGS